MSEIPEFNSSCYLEELSAILKNARCGDSLAENTVHKEFVDRLVRVASHRISSRFKAKIAPEEVVQSVFVSFFRRHRNHEYQFENWNELWAFLVRVTICKCSDRIDQFRTLKRDVQREFSSDESSGEEPKYELRSKEPTTEEIAIFEDSLDQLLDRLDAQQQQVVLLRLQGMSNLEISQLIGRTERSVYRILNQIKTVFLEIEPDHASR